MERGPAQDSPRVRRRHADDLLGVGAVIRHVSPIADLCSTHRLSALETRIILNPSRIDAFVLVELLSKSSFFSTELPTEARGPRAESAIMFAAKLDLAKSPIFSATIQKIKRI